MAIAIVTDSTSDIDPERAADYGVTVVPLFVVFGDRSYRDYVELSRAQFYEKLRTQPVLPITSQPTAAMFEEAFAPLVARGDEILCITVSSALSGTINAAVAGAAPFADATIRIFDSLSVAGGLGMMVERALTLAREGAAIDQIIAALERERDRAHLYACLADLSHIARTGRISKAKAAFGGLLKIVPVLTLDAGLVVPKMQVRTLSRAQESMIDAIAEETPDIAATRVRVVHTNAPELGANMVERLRARFAGAMPEMLDVQEAGPAIATHAGAGAVGIFTARR